MMELDEKDLAIIEALDSSWPKISTRQLSERLNIPSRTIRYRLARLKEMGVLYHIRIVTHERKLGLGKCFIVMDVIPRKENALLRILKQIPYIHSISSTYGRFNGYYLELLYSLDTPRVCADLLQALKAAGYIQNSYCIDLVDYHMKGIDFNSYDVSTKDWLFDWDDWHQNIETTYAKGKSFDFTFEVITKRKDFDNTDAMLLRILKEDVTLSLKELKERINLSEVQISRRLQRLEEKDIIKGYKFVLAPKKSHDLIYFLCFLETFDPLKQLLACIYQLPFLIEIFIETSTKLCLLFRLPADDYKSLLKGFDLLRPYLKYYTIQTIHLFSKSNYANVYDFYDKTTHSWKTPIKKYLELIKKK
jgi:DNA-binding Lrp family transcriptional regulator